jgi:hypothetical protein
MVRREPAARRPADVVDSACGFSVRVSDRIESNVVAKVADEI